MNAHVGRLDLPSKETTETQSASWILRERMIAAVEPLFAGFRICRNHPSPNQQTDFPFLGVYLMTEQMTPDGEWSAGIIRFVHNFTIGFEIGILNNDTDQAEQQLDAAWTVLMNGLWCNADLTNFFSKPPIEGVSHGTRRFVYGATGLNQDIPIASLQYEVTCVYRSDWAPKDFPALVEIAVTALPFGKDPAITQPIPARYIFAQPKGDANGTTTERGTAPAR